MTHLDFLPCVFNVASLSFHGTGRQSSLGNSLNILKKYTIKCVRHVESVCIQAVKRFYPIGTLFSTSATFTPVLHTW